MRWTDVLMWVILVLTYGISFYILYKSKLKRIMRMGIIVTSIYGVLSIFLAFFPAQMANNIKNPLTSLLIGISSFILFFIPLYYYKIIKVTYFGHELQPTIRKNLILLIIPLIILIYFKNDLSFLVSGLLNLWLLAFLVVAICMAAYVWTKMNKIDLFIKMFGAKFYISSAIITFCVQIIHTAVPEEFFYRIFLIGTLRPLVGETLAILLSAFIFGVCHVWFMDHKRKVNNRLAQSVTFHMTLGIFLGLVWTRFSVFYIPVILHALINTSSLTIKTAKWRHIKKMKMAAIKS
ncbi:MAG: CPBP family intramembrane metalloprotease [Halanaerobiales bacterium]|nr:CPBP family intramembrane metalloprotease [Halanaerobiales bacterium]